MLNEIGRNSILTKSQTSVEELTFKLLLYMKRITLVVPPILPNVI